MMSNRPGAPLFATINVTGVCNLKCKYCFYQPRSHDHMTWPDFQRVVNELDELKLFFINLSGGEPFIHPEIDRFIDFAHSKFHHVVLLTNGTVLEPRHIEAMTKVIQLKGDFPIQVSIDSVSSKTNRKTRGDASKVLSNIQTLNEIGANIVIAMVISRFNACSVIDSIIELSRYTTHFHLMTVQKVRALNGKDKDYMLGEDEISQFWDDILVLKKARSLHIDTPDDDSNAELGCAYGAPCMAGFSHVVIDPSLKVRPCDRCVQTFVGDLHNETMEKIWRGQAIKQVTDSPIPFCQRDDQILSTTTG